MREFTKSAMSFSWAMSIFGVQQMAGLLSPSKAAKTFDAVTHTTRDEFTGPLQTLFGAGDRLQSELVDLVFGPFSFGAPRSNGEQRCFRCGPSPVDTTTQAQTTKPSTQNVSYTPASRGPIAQTQVGGGWGAMPLAGDASHVESGQPLPAYVSSEAEKISSEYPFESHYVEVFGSRMHYIDEGEGDPILFVHGNATWSYIWRNVIPHLKPHGRCVALDLIGFGRSDKPHIEYQWTEQADYLEEFIRKLGLKNITLVLNDFGISLGMRYAMRHEYNVRGIAFFEGVFKTFKSLEEAYTPDFRPLFKQFRTGGEGGEGYKILVDQNLFIEQLLPRAAGRELTDEELRRYREPFKEVRSRIPIWRFARSVPIGGEPRDVWEIMSETTEWFKRTTLPKLLFYATPGGLVTTEFVEWCRRNLKNLKVVHVGPGVHYLQETSPHVIGRELVKWLGELGDARIPAIGMAVRPGAALNEQSV